MAQYKYSDYLTHSDHSGYDTRHMPGTVAQNAGIYRCVACGDEIGVAKSQLLAPQNHHQHQPGTGPIEWQLIVYAQRKG